MSAPEAKPPVESTPLFGKALTQVNPTRGLLMMAAGAILGLLIAGFGLFTANGTTSNQVPAEDVALVNHRHILISDYIAQVEAENGIAYAETTRAQRQKVVNDMIREELFVQRGLELDFPSSDPDTRAALLAAVEQQVAADVTAQQPTDTDLRNYYAAHMANYASDGTMTLDEVIAPGTDAAALAKANQAVAALRAGTPMEAVKATYGLKDSGRVNDGEEFYFAAKIHLGDKLFELARTLQTGKVSDPQPGADGMHILHMVKNNMPKPQTFEDARQKVFFDYKKAEQDKLEKADFNYLKNKADIQIAKEFQ